MVFSMEETKKVVYRNHPSPLRYLIYFIVGAGISLLAYHLYNIPAVIASIVVTVIVVAILRARHLFTVTVDRVTAREGLISRDTTEIQLRYVMGTHVKQGIVERILGIGSVEIFSAAETSARVLFRGIRDPVAVKDMINRMIQGKES